MKKDNFVKIVELIKQKQFDKAKSKAIKLISQFPHEYKFQNIRIVSSYCGLI